MEGEPDEVRAMYDERAQIAKVKHAHLYPNYRFTPMKRADKDRMREEKRQAKEQERADAPRHTLSRLPRQPRRPRSHSSPKPSSPTPNLPLHPSRPRHRRYQARRRRNPAPISRCATGRLMRHHMTRMRLRGGQTRLQTTHRAHRRVHRPILGPIYLSRPRCPPSPRTCSSPRPRRSPIRAGSPRNLNHHRRPSSALSRNSRSQTGRSPFLSQTKHQHHSRMITFSSPCRALRTSPCNLAHSSQSCLAQTYLGSSSSKASRVHA
ncbi:hypothetical protein EDB89DRAFT_403661 [Lactarius sanguifluus]|nr:hypothetical protein EDB89DRAFT_403661 [Lactarius sanguifluus]